MPCRQGVEEVTTTPVAANWYTDLFTIHIYFYIYNYAFIIYYFQT